MSANTDDLHYWRQRIFYSPRRDATKTYVSGLWLVDGNIKRQKEYYLKILPRTLFFLQDQNVVFYYEDENIAKIVSGFRFNSLHLVKRSVDQLPKSAQSRTIAENIQSFDFDKFPHRCRERGLSHYKRDFIGSGPAVYRAMLAIWLSKIDFVCEQVDRNPCGTDHFCWVDASVARFCASRSMNQMINLPKSGACRVYVPRLPARFFGEPIKFNASFISGSAASWMSLRAEFDRQLAGMVDGNYPIDDEVVLTSIPSEGLIERI